MQKETHKKWLLLISAGLVIIVGYFTFRVLNPRIVIYSDLWTYTMADDQTVYRIRYPGTYLTDVLPLADLNYIPESTLDKLFKFSANSSNRVFDWFLHYAGHVNLDYTLEVEGDQFIITFTGFGKLRDGTIETIDEKVTSPAFVFEDQMAGVGEHPGYPWDSPVTDPTPLRDPDRVIEPHWPEESP